jgi:Flp pilus assembly protein TadB
MTVDDALATAKGAEGMAEIKAPSRTRQRALQGVQQQTRLKRGNDAIVRVCMIGFSVAIAAIAPVTWSWKIALFLAIMFLVGIIMPAITRARRNPG